MSLTFNPFTGTFDFTGSGGGSATIGGTIAATQVAFGTALDTIGGSANLVWTGNVLGVGGTPASFWLTNNALDSSFSITDTVTTLSTNISGAFGNYNFGGIADVTVSPSTDDTDSSIVGGFAALTYVPSTSTHYISLISGLNSSVKFDGAGNASGTVDGLLSNVHVTSEVDATTGVDVYVTSSANSSNNRAFYGVAEQRSGGTATNLSGAWLVAQLVGNTSIATNLYGAHLGVLTAAGGATTNAYGIWIDSVGGVAPVNNYSIWSDEQGVFRIRADNTFNSVYQAIPALYNPQFTKYTAGATNFERLILGQWESNVATITTEAGGTGTLRAMNLGDTGVQVQINGKVITLGGAFTTSGAFALTLTQTGSTNVTLPTSGTLLTTAGSGASLTFPGTLSIASGKVLTASNTLTFTGTDSTSFAFPSTSDTVVALTATQTLTNKRITKRVTTASDATSITPNSDTADVTYQANTQAAGTLTINADAGTPTNGQSWVLKIKSTNVQTFSWNTIYVGGTIALPTATTGGAKIDYFVFMYDSVTPKWDYTGTAGGF